MPTLPCGQLQNKQWLLPVTHQSPGLVHRVWCEQGSQLLNLILLNTGKDPWLKLGAVAWLEFQILVGVCTAPSSYDAETRFPTQRHMDPEFGQHTVEVQVLAQSRCGCAT